MIFHLRGIRFGVGEHFAGTINNRRPGARGGTFLFRQLLKWYDADLVFYPSGKHLSFVAEILIELGEE